MKRAHLTKVHVQTFWVVVDDETGVATEVSDTGVAIPAEKWPGFQERHAADFARIQEQTMLQSEAEAAAIAEAAQVAAPPNGAPTPMNREARRAAARKTKV